MSHKRRPEPTHGKQSPASQRRTRRAHRSSKATRSARNASRLRATPIDRSSGVGASEAAAACGLSPYEQTVELYLRKTGQLPAVDETEEMLFGSCIEAGGIQFWSRLNGVPVTYPLPLRRHPDHPFVLATPDAQIGPREGLEFKSMSWQLSRRIDECGLADACPQYVLQAQQQMAVMEWDCVRLVGLVDRKLREWPIERNERLIKLLIEREATFWDHVERRVPPAVDFSKTGCLRAVQCLYPGVNQSQVQLDAETSAAWRDYEAAGRQIGDLNERREKWKATVLFAIGDRAAGVLADGERMVRRKLVQRAGYSVPPSEYVDVRAVKCSSHPFDLTTD